MSDAKGQVTQTAADVYDRFFVPALFEPWAPRLLDLATRPDPDQHPRAVLDVACGTGVLAREARRRFAEADVHGLDRNEGMLHTARRTEPRVEWRLSRAERLPYEDATVDVVTCQFGLMFFDDRSGAVSEMWRVLRPGGRLVVAVWADLEQTPGYRTLARLLDRLFGAEIARELHAPYCLGEEASLLSIFEEARVQGATAVTLSGEARFPSISDWLHTEIRCWTLAGRLSDSQFAALLDAARIELAEFADAMGGVAFRHDALVVRAEREGA